MFSFFLLSFSCYNFSNCIMSGNCVVLVYLVRMSSLVGHILPDGGGLVPFIQPILRRNDVHAPQPPVVPVSGVGILLHLKGVVFDVVYGRQEDPSALFFNPGQDWLRPEEEGEKQTSCSEMTICLKQNMLLCYLWLCGEHHTLLMIMCDM